MICNKKVNETSDGHGKCSKCNALQQLDNCATEISAEIILKNGKMVMLIRYMHVHLKIC